MEINGDVQRRQNSSQQMSACTKTRKNEVESRGGEGQEGTHQGEVGGDRQQFMIRPAEKCPREVDYMKESIVAYRKGVYGYQVTAKEFKAGMYNTELMAITPIQSQLPCTNVADGTCALVQCLLWRIVRNEEELVFASQI